MEPATMMSLGQQAPAPRRPARAREPGAHSSGGATLAEQLVHTLLSPISFHALASRGLYEVL